MTLEQQITEAQQALADLTADEQELTQLEAEQRAGIADIKSSKDFDALALLESRKAALSSMLAEQRQAIARARDEVARLEAAKVRGEALEDLRARCEKLDARRVEVDGLLTGLHDFLRERLAAITAARVAWAAELEEARNKAQQLSGLESLVAVYSQDWETKTAWKEVFEEIGQNAESALCLNPVPGYSASGMDWRYLGPVGQGTGSIIEAARRPLSHYLDRPVTLLIGEAVAEADRQAPHLIKGGER